MSAARKPSLAYMLRTARDAGLSIVRIEATPAGYSVFTADQERANVPTELEAAREARRARESGRA